MNMHSLRHTLETQASRVLQCDVRWLCQTAIQSIHSSCRGIDSVECTSHLLVHIVHCVDVDVIVIRVGLGVGNGCTDPPLVRWRFQHVQPMQLCAVGHIEWVIYCTCSHKAFNSSEGTEFMRAQHDYSCVLPHAGPSLTAWKAHRLT